MNQDKASIRNQLKLKRQQLSSEFCQQAALAILKQFECLKLASFHHIAVYLSHQNEIDLKPVTDWLWNQGKTCYLPTLHEDELRFTPYTPATEIIANHYGILEPIYNPKAVKQASELELMLLPLLAFDKTGHRLGMGKGYYDKSLASTQGNSRPLLIGCAYQFQCMEALPTEAWDIPLDMAITEQNTYDFRGKT